MIAVSDWERQEVLRRFDLDPERTFTVYPGLSDLVVAALDEPASEAEPPERPYVFMASTLYGFKNHARLIRAFARLARAGEVPHDLVLAGGDADVTAAELENRHQDITGPKHQGKPFVRLERQYDQVLNPGARGPVLQPVCATALGHDDHVDVALCAKRSASRASSSGLCFSPSVPAYSSTRFPTSSSSAMQTTASLPFSRRRSSSTNAWPTGRPSTGTGTDTEDSTTRFMATL